MKKDLFALKGTICYSKNQKELIFAENSYACLLYTSNRSNLYPAGDPGSYLSGSTSVDAVCISER